MDAKSAKSLTIEWFDRVWNQRDESAIAELMCERCDVKGLNLSATGPEGFIPFYRQYLETFDDTGVEIIELLQEGNQVAGHALFKGLHKASGKEIEVPFSLSATIENGQITEARNVVDFVAMLAQLELFDPSLISQVTEPAKV